MKNSKNITIFEKQKIRRDWNEKEENTPEGQIDQKPNWIVMDSLENTWINT